jgi:alpha-tubulin suppressor-like RCC1 family protein
VSTVIISPNTISGVPGQTQQFSVVLQNASGAKLTGHLVTWTSSNPDVATVSGGLARITGSGTATITAASEGASGTATIIGEEIDFEIISAGEAHSCGLTRAGKAYCWGLNYMGQLGNGTVTLDHTPTPLPTPVQTSLTFKQISAGRGHTVALTPDGKAYAWGYNGHGQLGNGTASLLSGSPLPLAVQTSLTFTHISAGSYVTRALTLEGKAYAWGLNTFGELGDGTTQERSIPTAVQTSLLFKDIAGGRDKTVALTREGRVYGWGRNYSSSPHVPTAVQTSLTFTQIAVGWEHAVALTPEGKAYALGSTPAAVQTSLTFTQISAGSNYPGYTVALTPEGKVYAWGDNRMGQLGDGTTTDRLLPTPVQTSLTFTHISAGNNHVVALTSGRRAYAWGYNNVGQLGDGTTTQHLTPTRVGR